MLYYRVKNSIKLAPTSGTNVNRNLLFLCGYFDINPNFWVLLRYFLRSYFSQSSFCHKISVAHQETEGFTKFIFRHYRHSPQFWKKELRALKRLNDAKPNQNHYKCLKKSRKADQLGSLRQTSHAPGRKGRYMFELWLHYFQATRAYRANQALKF